MEKRFRLMVLGAGFSRQAGFPLAAELWQEVRERVRYLQGRATRFNHDLEAYITYKHDCDGSDLTPESVDFEDFMRFLDIEHFLGLRGSDTWSKDGNEGTVITKYIIGEILKGRLARLDGIPELYLEFARRLQPGDVIITFNYDTLLEGALDAVEKPYRLFPHRYKSVGEDSAVVDRERDEVIVLKVHGSIDWFDRKGFEWQQQWCQTQGAPPPQDIIFSHVDDLRVRSLVDGPRFPNDPLRTIYRVGNLAALYKKEMMFVSTPRMLPPSSAKMVYANQLGDFWNGMNSGGSLNLGMAIIGFSLPAQDEYARQIIYSLVTNYQRFEWDTTIFGNKKTPLVVVTCFTKGDDETRFRERYRFVDWGRAVLHGGGFTPTTLDSIFQ